MVPPRSVQVRRRWFADARDDGRRMELSFHADQPFVIVSLWHHDVCRATFRLPIEDAAEVIGALADSLGQAARRGNEDASPAVASRPGLWARLRSRVPRPLGEVVAMAEHRGTAQRAPVACAQQSDGGRPGTS